MKLSGKTIVLTGASSGIGASAAKQLARLGAHVCIIARREDELKQVQQEITLAGGKAWIYPCDLTNETAMDETLACILAEHTTIDCLVNNAARSIRRPILDSLDRAHDFERTMSINFFAPMKLTLKLIPQFLKQSHGHVVNISTMSTQVPIPLFAAYLSSKSALESFTHSLNAELNIKGIKGTIVYFPMVRTPMSSKTNIYKHMRMMNVDEAAGWIVKAVLEQPAQVSNVMGKVSSAIMALMPGVQSRFAQPLFRLMDKRLTKKLHQK